VTAAAEVVVVVKKTDIDIDDSLLSTTTELSSSSETQEKEGSEELEESSFETVIVVEKNNEVDDNENDSGEDDEEDDEGTNSTEGSDPTEGFIKTECQPKSHTVENPYPDPDATAPSFFTVRFPTTVGLVERESESVPTNNDVVDVDASTITMFVNRSWAPTGVDRFHSLLEDHYYDCVAFFRVVPNFVVQFGIASEPAESSKWGGSLSIKDDPVLLSNTKGTVSFATAGKDTRTTQIFINLRDNSRLDGMGFSPFAQVTPESMSVLERIYNPTPDDSGGVNQGKYEDEGNDWILQEYPDIDIVMGSPAIVQS